MRIAVIDSGIDISHPRLKNALISGVYIQVNDEQVIVHENEFDDILGHGTACSAIIHKIVPQIEIVAVKILSGENNIDEKVLYEAIKWCLNYKDIKLISISLGCATNKPYHKLFEICEEAYKENIYIVAATHNDPTIECYPAYFPTVFGVCSGHVKNHREFGLLANERVNIIAKGITQRVAWINQYFKIVSGSSYAAAHFSGILANLISENNCFDRSQLEILLKQKSNPQIKPLHFIRSKKLSNSIEAPSIISSQVENNGRYFTKESLFQGITNVAIFPISEKEMSSFINFNHLCKLNITLLIDYPKTFSDIKNRSSNGEIIRRIPTEEEFKQIDALVLGYFYEHLFDANIEFGKKLIDKAIEFNKSFIVWSKLLSEYLNNAIKSCSQYTGKIIYPKVIDKDYSEIYQFGYLPSVTAPSILVIGTSNRQGKFTTQLRLLEILNKEGYKVELISTEPQGILFGSQYCFPYGHETTVELNEMKWSIYLSALMKGIQKYKNPHLFLSGIQSFLVPRSISGKELCSSEAFSSLHLIAGFQPDGLICAINPQDSKDVIDRMINAASIYSNGKILFFVMTPWYRKFDNVNHDSSVNDYRYLSSEEIKIKLEEFSSILKYPVLNIMDKNNDNLILEIIENEFAKKQ